MIQKFLEEYVKKIVQYPNEVSVSLKDCEENNKNIIIYTNSVDIGRVIGKDGKMIGSIKTFISGAKAKDGFTYKIVVESK